MHDGQLKFVTILSMSVNDTESTGSVDLGATNKLQRVGEFVNTESANNED